MNTFCTIISHDYYSFAINLFHSLEKFNAGIKFQILVTEKDIPEAIRQKMPEGITIYYIKDLENSELFSLVQKKYEYINDSFRWSLKPIFISTLLKRYDKVIYVDCDIHFFNDPSFLFEELNNTSILLSPHWGETNPLDDEENFLLNFRIGLYNAGFIGATAKGINALMWWANACSYSIENNESRGLYVDQRYLDLIPIIDSNAKILIIFI